MNWPTHNKWAEKMGVSPKIAQYVNKLIDEGVEALPPEDQERFYAVSDDTTGEMNVADGNSAFGEVVKANIGDHDDGRSLSSRSQIYSRVKLSFLAEKGEDYVAAWYLHHHLDYLHEERNSSKSFDQLRVEYRQKYPQAYSEEVEEFLIQRKGEIKQELGI